MAKSGTKTSFLVVSDHFPQKNEPNDLIMSLDIERYILPKCRPSEIFLSPFGVAQIAPK
jgi:hypothetical protein